MSSPKINKLIIGLEGTGENRVYEWHDNHLTMAELVVFLNMLGKKPESSRWLDSTDV